MICLVLKSWKSSSIWSCFQFLLSNFCTGPHLVKLFRRFEIGAVIVAQFNAIGLWQKTLPNFLYEMTKRKELWYSTSYTQTQHIPFASRCELPVARLRFDICREEVRNLLWYWNFLMMQVLWTLPPSWRPSAVSFTVLGFFSQPPDFLYQAQRKFAKLMCLKNSSSINNRFVTVCSAFTNTLFSLSCQSLLLFSDFLQFE